MRLLKSILAAVAISLAAVTPGLATPTFHYDDTVTYIKESAGNPNCIQFQTTWTGGVMGIDNSTGGDTTATGYTGGASFAVFGVGSGTNNVANMAGLIVAQLQNSRNSQGNYKLSWAEEGTSSSYYGDCASASTWYVATRFGQ